MQLSGVNAMTDVSIRPFRWDDLPALVDMLNVVAVFDQDGFHYTQDEVRHQFEQPPRRPEADVFLAVAGDGRVVGFTTTTFQADYGEWAWGCVHPDARRQRVGTRLLRAADAYIRQVAPTFPATVDRIVDSANTGAVRLLEAEGYAALRDHYELWIRLDVPFTPPPFPDGIALRPYVHERDGRAVWQAHDEAFRDHWGHVEIPYDQWVQAKIEDPRYDPSLWLVAVDGDQIAGLAILRRWDDHQSDLGHVDELAVRHPWRKRGLGLALLRQAFYRLQTCGFASVRLGVDAESNSNAVALYARAGMRIKRRYIIYRKQLTP